MSLLSRDPIATGLYGMSLFDSYMEQEKVLKRAGYHATSPFWVELLEEFSDHPTAYRMVGQVGRRGGKSTFESRLVPTLAVDREWDVPAGDPHHVLPLFSVKIGEAEQRLKTVVQILEVRGVPHSAGVDRTSPYVRLLHQPIEIRAMPANFRTAVGFTSIGFGADELARWKDDKTGANPASHVLQAVRPSMLTHMEEGATELLISSPWSVLDAHYAMVKVGSNDKQIVRAGVPTWVANPSLTIERCRQLAESEAGEGVDFDRDYACIPMPQDVTALFDSASIERAMQRPIEMPQPGDLLSSGCDLGFRRDSSALAMALRRAGQTCIFDTMVLQPQGEPLKPSEVIRLFATRVRAHDIRSVMSDHWYEEAVREYLSEHDLLLMPSPSDYVAPYMALRALLHEGAIALPNDEDLRRDLLETKQAVTKAGKVSVVLPRRSGGGHADLVAAIALAVYQTSGYRVAQERTDEDWEELELQEHLAAIRNAQGEDDYMVTMFED